jgi:hypothetical protein
VKTQRVRLSKGRRRRRRKRRRVNVQQLVVVGG